MTPLDHKAELEIDLARNRRETALDLAGELPAASDELRFGRIAISPSRRALRRGCETVKIGSRAFDLLTLLAERAGEVVGKDELVKRAWPNGDALGVPLNEAALGVLERQCGKHRTHVFTYRGDRLRSANNRAWRAALKACGIEDFRWHDLRHTWASWLRQNDVPTWVLQELGGWKSESMVRRYAHMSVKHLAPFADQLTFPVTPGDGGKPSEPLLTEGHKSGHSKEPFRLKLVAGTDLSH